MVVLVTLSPYPAGMAIPLDEPSISKVSTVALAGDAKASKTHRKIKFGVFINSRLEPKFWN
jgi:hypothetical protein